MNDILKNQYLPDSVSPPGETLLEVLSARGMSQAELADRTGRPTKTINEIIKGKAAITPETSLQFELVLGVSASFWNTREQQYRETLAITEIQAKQDSLSPYVTVYRSIRGWNEREAVSKLTCPRMVFVGSNDTFDADGYAIQHGPLIAEHRKELERMGWTVRLVPGVGHELGAKPDVVVPLVREFLDPLLLRS